MRFPSLPRLLLLATVLAGSAPLLPGCAAPQAGATEYATAMAPTFQKNAALGKEFQDVASRLKKGEITNADAADRFNRNAVPLAQEVANRAAAVHPEDPALAEAHAVLVKAWEDRAAAYTAAAKAFSQGDSAGFEAARTQIAAVGDREAAYLTAVNGYTQPLGVSVDLYPTGG